MLRVDSLPKTRRHQIELLESRLLLTGAGNLDNNFDFTGITTFFGLSVASTVNNIVTQPDGKIVEVGQDTDGYADIIRYNTDGTPDANFGSNGLVRFHFGPIEADRAVAAAIQADGDIVVVGDTSYDSSLRTMAAARFDSDGTRDKTFGFNGLFISFSHTFSAAVLIQNGTDQDSSNDLIVLVGTAQSTLADDNDDMLVYRLTDAGGFDPNFGGGLQEQIGFGAYDTAFAATLDMNGGPRYQDIVIAGSSGPFGGATEQFAVARLNASDGSPDTSFSGDGKIVSPFVSEDTYSVAHAVVVQPDDRIVVAGEVASSKGSATQVGVIRLNTNGSGDSTFGVGNGQIALSMGGKDSANGMVIGQNGDLIIDSMGFDAMHVACLTANGQLDTVFAGGGIETVALNTDVLTAGLSRGLFGTLFIAGGHSFNTAQLYDRGLATVSITSFDTTASENGPDPASFEIFQKETRTLDTDVFFTPSGTASSPAAIPRTSADYTGINQSFLKWLVDITPGENTAIVFITPIDDTRGETNETAIFTIQDRPGVYDVVQPSSVTLTILDNDQAVSGTIYNDANGNSAQDANEAGIGGVQVYLDKNNNSKLDSGELSTTTTSSGSYLIPSVPVGSYVLRQIVPAGYAQEIPTSNAGIAVTMAAKTSVVGKTFADKPTANDATSVTLQAETATLLNGTVASSANTGYIGTGYADFGDAGSAVEWTFNRFNAGSVPLAFRYANGSTVARPFSIVVNGQTIGSISGVPTGSWTTWSTVTIGASLKAGTNIIDATATAAAGGANLDSLTINTSIAIISNTYQAESAVLAGGTVAAHDNAGYTGSGYADFGGNGSSATFTVTRTAAGSASLTFRYANGGTANRPLAIVVNGVTVGTIPCVPTGSWTTWTNVSINTNLNAGNNTVKATANSSVGGANVDSLTVDDASPVVTYQGESAALAGGTVAAHANTGYTGTGYADFGSTNSSATFTVSRTAAGSATLTFRYANGGTANRPLSVTINGTVVGSVTFAPTGSWTTWATLTLNVSLLSGNNAIKLTVTGTDGPNLDWLSVG